MKKQALKRTLPALALSAALALSLPVLADEAPAEPQPVSREYTVAALLDSVGIAPAASTDALSAFSDAWAVSPEYAPAMAAAVEMGILKGYEDATLRPAEAIDRLEALLFYARALPETTPVQDPIYYNDIPTWAQEEIDRLSSAALMVKAPGTHLNSRQELTAEDLDALLTSLANQKLLLDIAAANDSAALLQNRSSVLMVTDVTDAGESSSTEVLYTAPELTARYTTDADGRIYGQLISGDVWLNIPEDDTDMLVRRLTPDNSLPAETAAEISAFSLNIAGMRVTDCRIDGGKMVLQAEKDPGDTREAIEGILAFRGVETPLRAVGEILTVNPETLEVESIEAVAQLEDGTAEPLFTTRCVYDEVFEVGASPFAPYFSAEKLRPVTIVFHPGTELETVWADEMPKGYFQVWDGEEWTGTLYTDPELTQRYAGSEPEDYSPMTLYVA